MASEIKDLLQKVIQEKDGVEGLEITEVTESPCTKPGDNFMSMVSVADVVGKISGGAPYSNKVFLKRPLQNSQFKELYQADQAFMNEATVYLKVFPLYDVTMPCPRCYYADKDLLVLEDLGKDGYRMADRTRGFDLETAKLVVKALVKYHAASFHASITKKTEFEEVTGLFNPIGPQTSDGSVMLEVMFQQIVSQLEGVPEMKPVVDTLKPVQGKLYQTLEYLGKARKIPVLCHGDFWINNILVQLDAEVPVKLMDFQQCRGVTSPVVDVFSFMYTSLKPSVMDEHFEDLLQFYCKSFVDESSSLNLPADKIPATADIMEELTSKEFYGFLIGSLYLPATTMDPGSIPKLESFTKEQMMDPSFLQQIMLANMKDKLSMLVKTAMKRNAFSKLKGAL